jgi:serine/threonine-protein kinase
MEQATFKQDTIIGSWRTGKLLGRGGQGGVWVARPTNTKNAPPRALKACFATDAKDRARFEREAALLKDCKSPLIVALHDLDLTWKTHVPSLPEFAYYVAEGCDGSLEQLREHLGDAGVRIKLFIECCNAVQYLHSLPEPVIHRDIKPANFLVAPEPKRVVLSDLGIAKYEAVASDLTVPQEVVGSRYYRPPEAMNGDPGSVRGDVYSLGRVFEWLMTGDVSTNFSTRPVPRGDYLSDELCDALDRVVVKATQPSPENRFASVPELLAQIPDRWVSVRPRAVAVTTPAPEDPRTIVDVVLDLAWKADTIATRSLEQDLRKVFPTAVTTWRQKYETQAISEQTLPAVIDDLLDHTFGRLALDWQVFGLKELRF